MGSRMLSKIGVAVLVLLAFFSVSVVLERSAPFFAPGWERVAFYDFPLWRAGIERFEQTGQLYETNAKDYFAPGNRSLYKYPPTFGASLRLFHGRPQGQVGRIYLWTDLLLVVIAYLQIRRAFRPGRMVGLLGFLLLLTWAPLWESLSDLQMEAPILACIAATSRRRPAGRSFYPDSAWAPRRGVSMGDGVTGLLLLGAVLTAVLLYRYDPVSLRIPGIFSLLRGACTVLLLVVHFRLLGVSFRQGKAPLPAAIENVAGADAFRSAGHECGPGRSTPGNRGHHHPGFFKSTRLRRRICLY